MSDTMSPLEQAMDELQRNRLDLRRLERHVQWAADEIKRQARAIRVLAGMAFPGDGTWDGFTADHQRALERLGLGPRDFNRGATDGKEEEVVL